MSAVILPRLGDIFGQEAYLPKSTLSLLVAGAVLTLVCGVALRWATHTRRREAEAVELSLRALDGTQITIARMTGEILLWSGGCEQLYGWTEQEAHGRAKYELVGSRCQQPDFPGLPRATGIDELELIERRRDGSEINILECSYAIDRPGRERLIASKIVDITRRVESEVSLRLSEARLRGLFEATPSAMVVLDAGATIVEFNPAAERLWGYRAADLRGQPLSVLTLPENRAPLEALVACELGAQAGDPARCEIPAIGLAREGGVLSLEVSSGRADTPGGVLVTLFFRDISEHMLDEQRIGELSAELAHVSRQGAMSELAADLAHELNQPLSATANFLATARMLTERGEKGEHIADLLRMAEEQTQRSGEIIRGLRDFLAKRDVEMRSEPVEPIVRDAVALVLFGRAPGARPALRLVIGCAAVFANRIQIQQVLVNLLRNAVEAQRAQPPGKRTIVVESRRAGRDRVEISVRDFGPGLPDDFADRLLERFSTSKGGAAMGIGLSISRRIVEAHGGTLLAENMPDGGAKFRFTLPIENTLPEPEPSSERESATR